MCLMSSPPKTRGECRDVPRPCPRTRCVHHLDVERKQRSDDPERETCALDVAEDMGSTLVQIGAILGVTRERVRQLESEALAHLGRNARRMGIELPEILGAEVARAEREVAARAARADKYKVVRNEAELEKRRLAVQLSRARAKVANA